MTLGEAIEHENELAKEIYVEAMLCHANPDDGKLDDCIERGKYHEQITEWLEELKRRREYDGEIIGSGTLNNAYNQGYNKALDDIVTIIKERVGMDWEWDYYFIDEIAEQLKEKNK